MKTIKYFLITLLVVSVASQANAQNYKKEKLRVEYTSFPINPLPESTKTFFSIIEAEGIDFTTIEKQKRIYHEIVNADGTVTNNYSSPEKAAKEYLSLRGYEWDEENPDVILKMEFSGFDIKDREEVQMDLGLNLRVQYTYGAVFKVLGRNGNIIFEEKFRDPGEVKKYLIGPDGFTKTLQEFNNEYEVELTRDFLQDAENLIKSNFSYTLYYIDHLIYTDKTNRKNNYDDLNKAVDIMEETFDLITREERKPIDELYQDPNTLVQIKSKLDEAVRIWEKVLEEADFDDRKARIHGRLAPMLYCNIATAQIYRKDWDAADAAIKKALSYDESKAAAMDLQSRMSSLKKRYEIHGIE